ncbi:DUF4492 domain-containing protein [Xylanibacter muris]|uniref:DUF4492 domain-containing protein n=1 Tax=Xylanibacter muris TaxID=2736290 RepID=A0ABX2AML1_9BACT|nr:DUF4492 domain-containing protein [Xylanibacter muris]NPD92128.1 DUF4492 domain-containing protein [Xylanibacter muris]
MRIRHIIYNVYNLYADGFRNMSIGKTLWKIIIIKLIIIFAILKIFFFPDFIGSNSKEGNEADFVATEVIKKNTIKK